MTERRTFMVSEKGGDIFVAFPRSSTAVQRLETGGTPVSMFSSHGVIVAVVGCSVVDAVNAIESGGDIETAFVLRILEIPSNAFAWQHLQTEIMRSYAVREEAKR